LLLLIGIPILGGIIVLYLLKLRRKDFVVPSVMLWEDITKDVQANAPFQKLRKSLLLFLQLAVAAILVFALARPFVLSAALKGESVAIILDGSASMKATDVGGSRFDVAKAEAEKLVDRLSRGDEAMVILAGLQTEVLAPFTGDKTALRRAIASAQASDTPTNLRDALVLASQSAHSKKRAHIFLLSDGAVTGLEGVSLGKAEFDFRKIGARSDNLGITAMDVRRGYGKSADFELFCAVSNFSPEKKRAQLELDLDGHLIDAREVSIDPKRTQSIVFGGFGGARGVIGLKISKGDDLASDDVAYCNFTPKATIDVLLVTPSDGNILLEEGLNSDPRTAVSKTDPKSYEALASSERGLARYDLVVFDRYSPKADPPGATLFFAADSQNSPARLAAAIAPCAIVDWSSASPLNRFVDYSQVLISQARTLKPRAWGDVVAECASGPVIVCGERRSARSIIVGFDVSHRNSDFGLRAAFPIFLTNCITWLGARVEFGQEVLSRVGQPILIQVPKELGSLEVTKPDGSVVTVKVASSPLAFNQTDQVGLYRFRGRDFAATRAVDLLDKRESDIEPKEKISIGGHDIGGATSVRTGKRELWRYLAILAIGLLCLEWSVYHRRL
jgi:Ca-activated chloride channel family protein